MERGESFFNGVDGGQMFYQYWRPDGGAGARAAIAVCHGLGEHGGRYQYLAEAMVARQFCVYALDHRGHGRSEGQRGHVDRWEVLREDLHTFVGIVRQQEPGQPLFLFGHSLGGLIALDYALAHPRGLQGVIASAPAVLQTAISPVKVSLAKMLSRLTPTLSMQTGLDPAGISRDPVEVQHYQQDPLVHDVGTTRLGAESFAAQDRTLAAAGNFNLPLLLVHGEDDFLIPVLASRSFYERAGSADKELILYPGGYHESHNDIHREQYFDDLAVWIENHL